MTAVGSGDPVVLFKPVLEGAAGEQKSDSSVSIGVDRLLLLVAAR